MILILMNKRVMLSLLFFLSNVWYSGGSIFGYFFCVVSSIEIKLIFAKYVLPQFANKNYTLSLHVLF